MPEGFWKNLQRPIMVIAPMSNVTDEPFRLMFLKYGRPAVFWTEFVSSDGLFSRGKEACLEILKHDKAESPIVAQVFGGQPENFEKVAALVKELGFDGLDINMGCPNRDIEKVGGGAALMKNPTVAKELIRAAKRGAPDLPISVKTRLGYEKVEIDQWLPTILEEDVSAISIHFRTRRQLYLKPAHWEFASKVKELRDKNAPQTLLIGNGDVKTLEEANNLVQETGLDGVMIGRGILGNPWFFSGHKPNVQERLAAIVEHTRLFEDFYKDEKGECRNFYRIRKHLHAYCKGFIGAKELREDLMRAKNRKEVELLVEKFLAQ